MKFFGYILPSLWLLSATTTALNPELDDPKWPGAKPENGTTNAITVNIQFDDAPEEVQWRLEQFVGGVSASRQITINIGNSNTAAPAATTTDAPAAAATQPPVDEPATTLAPTDGWDLVQDGSGTAELAGLLFNSTIGALRPDAQYRFVISDSGVNNTGWVTVSTEAGVLWSLGGDILAGDIHVVDLSVDEGGTVGLATVDLFGTSYSITGTTVIDHYAEGLGGAIPTTLGLMTAVTYLNLGSNFISGPIPSELGKLTALTGMGLFENQLTGIIPTELGMLTSLSSIGLYNNQLTGAIPSEFGSLSALTGLALSGNELSGIIPWEFRPDGLMAIYLHDTQLSGNIPSGFCFLTALNRLTVDCDEMFCNCGALCTCDY